MEFEAYFFQAKARAVLPQSNIPSPSETGWSDLELAQFPILEYLLKRHSDPRQAVIKFKDRITELLTLMSSTTAIKIKANIFEKLPSFFHNI